ncbi:MAG: HDOD domain-containing protein, partial [Syntrophomonas sp.]|nr:HDOD domain-containing protein [Syntrophomonas sp.]
EMESPDPSLKKIAEIIAQDLTMTARVLQLVNSSFFGLASKVTHPQQAVALLGINTLKALVLNIQFFSAFHTRPSVHFSAEHLWKHSLMVGNGARLIIHLESPDPKLEEKAMIAGILHDIGKLPLLELPDHYARLNAFTNDQQCSPIEAEYQLLGTSHAEVGAYLLGLWGLPDFMLEPVLFHHHPSILKEKGFSVLTAVHVANALLPTEHDSTCTPPMSSIDIAYLSSINMLTRLIDWQDLFYQILERDKNEKKNTAGR